VPAESELCRRWVDLSQLADDLDRKLEDGSMANLFLAQLGLKPSAPTCS